jgi:hypothetical protein
VRGCCENCVASRRLVHARAPIVEQQILHQLRRACTCRGANEDLHHRNFKGARGFSVCSFLEDVADGCSYSENVSRLRDWQGQRTAL